MALYPFGPRVVVAEPPGGNEPRHGLFLPDGAEHESTKRGIVVETVTEDADVGAAFVLKRGDVVHYERGHRIGDFIVVDMGRIVAVEREPED